MKKSMTTGRVRGASMVEYAVLLFAVVIVAAIAVKKIGPKVTDAATQAESKLNTSTE